MPFFSPLIFQTTTADSKQGCRKLQLRVGIIKSCARHKSGRFEMKLKRLCYLLMVLVLFAAVSCKKNDIASNTNTNTTTNDTIGNGNNNGGTTTYYFYFNSTGTNLDYHAGSTKVYFDSNSEWSVTLDKSHFEASASVSPDYGHGKGYVVVTYGEESDHYDCNDYLYVEFRYVDRLYANGNKHYGTKTYTITRRYHLIHP